MRWHSIPAGVLAFALASSAWAQTGGAPRRLALAGARVWNAQESAAAERAQTEKKEGKKTIRLVWNDRPSFRFGDLLRVDVRFKFQGDFRGSQQDLADSGGLWALHRRRIGVEGTFLKHFEYEVEKELEKDGPWRDVFVNFRYLSSVQVQVGKFKVPFSLEQTTGATQLDFAYRSLLADQIAPGRDVGAMVHGRLFRTVRYEAGMFRRDGEKARITEPMFLTAGEEVPSQRSVAARVLVTPLRAIRGPEQLKNLEAGVALTRSTVPEGLNSFRGSTLFGHDYFPYVYVRGRRIRFGTEANWSPGPFSIKSEFVRAQDAREKQGLGDEDLSDLVAQGWYIAGTWAVTGEKKAGGIEPRKEFLRGGVGAIELAARYERLSFGSTTNEGPAYRNPRADNILGNDDRIWTLGVNWYADRWTKIQFDAIREQVEDPVRSPVPARKAFWSAVFRLQFVM